MAKTQPLLGAVEQHSLSGRTSKQPTNPVFFFDLEEQEETRTDEKGVQRVTGN